MHCVSSGNDLHSDFNTCDCWRTQSACVFMSLRAHGERLCWGLDERSWCLWACFLPFCSLTSEKLPSCNNSSPLTLLFFSFSFIPLLPFFMVSLFSQPQSYSFFLSPPRKIVHHVFSEYTAEDRTGCNRK